jgi:hypothetical protein
MRERGMRRLRDRASPSAAVHRQGVSVGEKRGGWGQG